jgi:elongation factor Ts
VPAEALNHEKEIVRSQIKGKPENIIDKIVEGKIKSFYESACLNCQKFIKDDTIHISDFVQKRAKETGKPLAIASFLRWSVGQ